MSRLPIKIKERAFKLRTDGYSVKEIADKLHIAKSTSSLWVRNIKLNQEAQKRLEARKLLGYYRGGLTWQKKRIEAEKQRRILVLKVVNRIKKDSNHLKIYCALLYWCEGGKNEKDSLRFINSDPALIRTFLTLFRKSFITNHKKFRVLLHLHEYHNEKRQKEFWSSLTKIPKNQFLKSFRKQHTAKRIKENYPGCATIYYYDVRLARELRSLYKTFFENLID